jgi:hypothetical protein
MVFLGFELTHFLVEREKGAMQKVEPDSANVIRNSRLVYNHID